MEREEKTCSPTRGAAVIRDRVSNGRSDAATSRPSYPALLQQHLQARLGLHDLRHQEERSAGEAGVLLHADLQQPLHEGFDPPQHHVGLQRLVQQVEEHALPGGRRKPGVQQLPAQKKKKSLHPESHDGFYNLNSFFFHNYIQLVCEILLRLIGFHNLRFIKTL